MSHTQKQLAKCNNLQRHRGPDHASTWISPDDTIGLAHARLATRDLSAAGRQPLHSTNGLDDIHIVVNGELYYPDELRKDLAREYELSSSSDSEMAIALYRRHGSRFVEHLRGEFPIVLWDGAARRLIITRDRFGIKPLHYGVFGDRLLVATQCKGIAGLLNEDERLQWDPVCFAQGSGHYGYRTLFEGIRKVPAGHVAVIREEDSLDDLVFRPYWRTHFPVDRGMNDDRPTEKLVGELRALLYESVEIRVKSTDVPIGLLLSGGVDSSAVAGMAAEICRGQREMPTCYTIAFPGDDELDESAIAARTAKHLGLPLVKVQVTEQAMADEFDESCLLGEVPMWDLQHIAKKILSRQIHEDGLRVVLNGDGSDELFAGYNFSVGDRLLGDDQRRCSELQNGSHDAREQALRDFEQRAQFFGRVRELPERSQEHRNNNAIQKLGLPPFFCELPIFPHDGWLREDVKALSDPFQAILECFSPQEIEDMQACHPPHKALLAWQKTLLPNLVIAAISDGAEMAHSVESRVTDNILSIADTFRC